MSELSVAAAAVGFHGKIPSRGDFIQRGLPQSFVDRWDRWLQEVLACTKAMAPDTWLDSYLTAPIWRFYMSPGVVGDSAWVGVVMPSVDNVNRYFPLTIASTASHSNLYEGIGENADWFAAAEDIAFQALDDEQFDPDSIAAAIDGLPAVVGREEGARQQAQWDPGDLLAGSFTVDLGADIATVLSDAILQRCMPGSVCFWSVADSHERVHLIESLGVDPSSYLFLFGEERMQSSLEGDIE